MNLISLLWYKDDHELLNSVLKHNIILDRSVNLHDLEQQINDYYYSIKRISLDINDPIRNYIYNLV